MLKYMKLTEVEGRLLAHLYVLKLNLTFSEMRVDPDALRAKREAKYGVDETSLGVILI